MCVNFGWFGICGRLRVLIWGFDFFIVVWDVFIYVKEWLIILIVVSVVFRILRVIKYVVLELFFEVGVVIIYKLLMEK